MTEGCVFNEKVHAFLIGSFYREMKAAKGPAGVECFIKAVQKTAEQRGHRMALRAMRDEMPLDYNTYMAYGEIYATIPGKRRWPGSILTRRHGFTAAHGMIPFGRWILRNAALYTVKR